MENPITSNSSTTHYPTKQTSSTITIRDFQTDFVRDAEHKADIEFRRGLFRECVKVYEDALNQLDQFESQSKIQNQNSNFILDRVFLLNKIARMWNELTNFQKSLQSSTKCIQLMRENNLTETLDYGVALSSNSNSKRALSRSETTKELFENVEIIINLRSRLAGPNSTDVAKAYLLKARCIISQNSEEANSGKPDEAQILLEKAKKIYENLSHFDHEYAFILASNASFLVRTQNPIQSLDLFKQALSIFESEFGRKHPFVARTLVAMSVHNDPKQPDIPHSKQAFQLLNEAKSILEETVGVENLDFAMCGRRLAILYAKEAKLEFKEQKALDALQSCLDIQMKLIGPIHMEIALTLKTIGDAYDASTEDNYAKTKEYFEKALEMYEQTTGKWHIAYGTTLYSIAYLESNKGFHDVSLKLYLKAKDVFERSLGRLNSRYANTCLNIGNNLMDMNRNEEALKYFLECKECEEKSVPNLDQHPNYASTLVSIGRILIVKLNRTEEALEYFKQATKLNCLKPKPSVPLLERIRVVMWPDILAQTEETLKRDKGLALFSGDMRFVDSKISIFRLSVMAKSHFDLRTPLSNALPFDISLPNVLMEKANKQVKPNDSTFLFLALCISHRLLAPNVVLDYKRTEGIPNFTKLSWLSWKRLIRFVCFVRIFDSSTKTAQSMTFRQKSILMCLLRTILDDPTPNQHHFQSILEFAKDRKTLGTEKKDFFRKFIIPNCVENQTFDDYCENLNQLSQTSSPEHRDFLSNQFQFLTQFGAKKEINLK